MTRRYFAEELPPAGGMVMLSDLESRHAIQVMRVAVGDQVTLFDGMGNESVATVREVTRRECYCEAETPQEVDRETTRRLQLGIALPKPERMQDLIERLTELGVDSLTPLLADRSQRPPSEKRLEKLKRYVVEACKQSGRNRLMTVKPVERVEDFFAAPQEGAVKLIAEPGGQRFDSQTFEDCRHVVAAIGPEGGWTQEEIQTAVASGFQKIDLGPRIYRIETAATTIATASSLTW